MPIKPPPSTVSASDELFFEITVGLHGSNHLVGLDDVGLESNGPVRSLLRLLPVSDTRILDVGPSYVVVSAIAVAVLYGSWPARVAAAADFAALVLVGHIFGGLTALDVAAVGHLTAITVAILLGSLLGPVSKLVRHAPHRESPPVGQ